MSREKHAIYLHRVALASSEEPADQGLSTAQRGKSSDRGNVSDYRSTRDVYTFLGAAITASRHTSDILGVRFQTVTMMQM